MYNAIFNRKSTRKYDFTPLDAAQMKEIKQQLIQLVPLDHDIQVDSVIVGPDQVTNYFSPKAPYFLVISSEEKPGALENVGFMFQQMDLFFSSKGLGSCWVGGVRPAPSLSLKYPFAFVLEFGTAKELTHRSRDQFKRKALSEISSGTDERLEAARLAPSAQNGQPWFFLCQNGKIHVYRQKLSLVKGMLLTRMSQVDIGIALCHLMLATVHEGKEFLFKVEENAPEKEGYIYFGTVQ